MFAGCSRYHDWRLCALAGSRCAPAGGWFPAWDSLYHPFPKIIIHKNTQKSMQICETS
nr:MAG TPA: hypothetical protein [Caudoviricetes sp.]